MHSRSTSRRLLRALGAALGGVLAAAALPALAAPKTVCTITINSPDEKQTFQRHLPPDEYRFVELVERGRPDWLASACRRGVTCDALIISGHFDDGTEFYTDRLDAREFLTVHQLQEASCSASCGGLFSQLKEVYLFGCNTLQASPRHVASPEIARSLQREGHAPDEARQRSALLSERYGQSNRDRLRHVFKDVPVLYGFSSKAPLGQFAGPMLERYFRNARPGEVGSGQPSSTLLGLFGPTSMIALPGLTDQDPHLSLRRDVCGFADGARSPAQKVAFMHQVLQRESAEVRMFLDHLERQFASLTLSQRVDPLVAAELEAIAHDRAARERFLAFERDADTMPVQARMITFAAMLGWLSPAQEQDEVVGMLADRMRRGQVGKHEVDLVCASERHRDAQLAPRLAATGAIEAGSVAHSAVLACLGDPQARVRTVRALTGTRVDDVTIAQTYLRHRPGLSPQDLRAVASGLGSVAAPEAQVRALEALARQPVADVQTLQELVHLFPRARSLDAQRAIASILIRSDRSALARGELAGVLRRHRLKSNDGSDVIDVLLRLLDA